MKFQDLPPEVQVVAAQTLSGKLCQSGFSIVGKTEPAKELAREVRDAFVELYSPSDEGKPTRQVEIGRVTVCCR